MHQPRLLSLVSALTDSDGRREAARIVARHAGADDLVIFVRDTDLGMLLPAPGFIQTLPNAREWHLFVAACQRNVSLSGRLSFPRAAQETPATGIAGEDGSVLVLLGGEPNKEIVLDLAFLLPLLAAAFERERTTLIARGHAKLAKQSAEQAKVLAASLDMARGALRKALSDAEEANRAKDRFLASLSHELRTPLTPVLIAITALQREAGFSQGTQEDLEMIRRNVEMEVNLIDDLLDLNRVIAGKLRLRRETLDFNTLVRRTLQICAPHFREKKIRLVEELLPATIPIEADATRIQQVFWNLLQNAVKFTPENGRIIVSTEIGAGCIARFRVRDTGIGIEPEALSRIFKVFEQANASTPREFGGLGLGLAISKAIIVAHEGELQAESTGCGHGSTFVVELPMVSRLETEEECKPPLPFAVSHCKARILVAEDHPDTARLLVRILGKAGHQVKTAATVATALPARRPRDVGEVVVDADRRPVLRVDLGQEAARPAGTMNICSTR